MPDKLSSSLIWNAANYNKSSSAQQKWAQELIGKLRLRGDERVHESGAGTAG